MSDEVSNFLRSVEQLNHRRDEDEEARSKEREEQILQQRRERQARREGTYLCCTVYTIQHYNAWTSASAEPHPSSALGFTTLGLAVAVQHTT